MNFEKKIPRRNPEGVSSRILEGIPKGNFSKYKKKGNPFKGNIFKIAYHADSYFQPYFQHDSEIFPRRIE